MKIAQITGKPVAAFSMELELGMTLFPTTNHEMCVYKGYVADVNGDRTDEMRFVIHRDYSQPREKPAWLDDEASLPIRGVDGNIVFLLPENDVYETLEELLSDWPEITSRPVWSTICSEEREAHLEQWREEYEKKERQRAEEARLKWEKEGWTNPFDI